jgi:hypothetical protein
MSWKAGILAAAFFLMIFAFSANNAAALDLTNCSILSTPGGFYNLTQDITNSSNTTCMNVTADNVTLDCGGRMIDGTDAGSSYGIYMKNRKNITIRNCSMNDWYDGIYMNLTYNSTASYNNLTSSTIDFELTNSNYNNITDNYAESISGTSIYIVNSSYNYIGYTRLKSNNVGISLESSSKNNTFYMNYIENTGTYGIYIFQSYDNLFLDSVINATSTNVYHFASTNSMFLNVSLDKTKITVDAGSVYVKWYLDTIVLSQDGSPLDQANVNIKDAYNATLFSGQTNASGYIQRQNTTEFLQNTTGKFYYSNYTINATKSGYVPNQTSVNLTTNTLATVRLYTILLPYVQVKTYDLGLSESDKFRQGRTVRIRAEVNYTSGSGYIMNSTVLIKNNAGSTVVNNAPMTNLSNITNGYIYEYNYTLPTNGEGLWTINVTSTSYYDSKGYDTKKIAVTSLTIQVKLVLNSTADNIYIPSLGAGEKSFSQLSTATYASPDHYYIASYNNDILKSVVASGENPLSIFTDKSPSAYGIGTEQRYAGSMVFIVFSKGNWRAVNSKMGIIENGEFLASPEPSFAYGLGNEYPLKIVLKYDNIDINRTSIIWRGYNRLKVEKTGSSGGKAIVDVGRI